MDKHTPIDIPLVDKPCDGMTESECHAYTKGFRDGGRYVRAYMPGINPDAVPGLVEALREIETILDGNNAPFAIEEMYQIARAALAKAEGGA